MARLHTVTGEKINADKRLGRAPRPDADGYDKIEE
jgi:hypothetical protein